MNSAMNNTNPIQSASCQHVLIERIPKSNAKNYLIQYRFNVSCSWHRASCIRGLAMGKGLFTYMQSQLKPG